MDATGHPSSSAFTSLCTKTTDFQSFASTYGGAWRTLYKFNDGGIWADHSRAEFTGSVSGTALTVASTQFGSTSSFSRWNCDFRQRPMCEQRMSDHSKRFGKLLTF